MTTWLKDDRGNKCSIEYFGSREAAQQGLDSLKNCADCTNCSGCSGCSDCSDCSRCLRCLRCSRCSGCSGCSRCSRIAWLDERQNLQGDPAAPDRGPPVRFFEMKALAEQEASL